VNAVVLKSLLLLAQTGVRGRASMSALPGYFRHQPVPDGAFDRSVSEQELDSADAPSRWTTVLRAAPDKDKRPSQIW